VSTWKLLRKKGMVKSVKNGDVMLFVAALMAVNCVYDRDAAAVSGGAARRVLASLRGRGFRDYVAEKIEREKRSGLDGLLTEEKLKETEEEKDGEHHRVPVL
jgi:hypothetical protein